MFKDLLNKAKAEFTAHQREEEIKHLDIDPEEYVMLRDDKNSMGVDLLKSILEKLQTTDWDVDERTFRIVRHSESAGFRREWSIALTSDTRRFHLKVYRDFDGELDGLDLGLCRGICAAIKYIDLAIQDIYERKIKEAEMRRLAAIEEENRRKQEELKNIQTTVEQINETCRNLYLRDLNSEKLGKNILTSAAEYIIHKVKTMPQTLVSLQVDDIASVRAQFGESQFKIIDNVPCKLDEENMLIHVSNRFIVECIDAKNFVVPIRSDVRYEAETGTFVHSLINQSGEALQSCSQHYGMQSGRIDARTDPLKKAKELLLKVKDFEMRMQTDVPQISLLAIKSESSSFKEVMKSIDVLLAYINENVKLIVWKNNQLQ